MILPPPAHHLAPQRARPVPELHQRTGPGPVLELAGLLRQPADAARTDEDLGIGAEMHHCVHGSDAAATPAGRADLRRLPTRNRRDPPMMALERPRGHPAAR